MWRLIRFAFTCGRRLCEQGFANGIIEGVTQVGSGRDAAAQISNNDLVDRELAIRSDVRAASLQCDADDSVAKPRNGSAFVKNEWRMRHIVNRDCSPLRGARIGVIGHDGTYRYWEWDDTEGCFVPLALV
jgi:hypothetical protein